MKPCIVVRTVVSSQPRTYFTLYCLLRRTIEQLSNKFSTPLPPLMLDRRVTENDDATPISCRLHLIFMLDVYAQIYNASIFTGLLKRSRRSTAMTRLEADKTRTLHRQATVRWYMRGSTGIAAGGTHQQCQQCLREPLPGGLTMFFVCTVESGRASLTCQILPVRHGRVWTRVIVDHKKQQGPL
ncbi:hypothetical protein BN1723_013473, partial [Verticillium longisporum]